MPQPILLLSSKQEISALIGVIILGVTIRVIVMSVFSSQYPPIDAFIVNRESANVILNLQNPYTYSFPVHNYMLNVFAYLPGVPLYYAPFYLVGDFRYGSIFADVLIMLAVFWIAKSYNKGVAVIASLAYALLPPSIWLSSITGTNIMVGTAFLILSFAALMRKRFGIAAILLGLGVAANQLVALMLPLFALYYWSERKISRFSLSLLVSAAIILPFLVANPTAFLYGVVEFQFVRPAQLDGSYSLYSVVSNYLGIQLSFYVRAAIFIVPFAFTAVWSRHKPNLLLVSAGVMLFLAAFVLPINGFWNYFIPSLAILCALAPLALEQITQNLKPQHPNLLPKDCKA